MTDKNVAFNVSPQDGSNFHQFPWSAPLEPGWESSYGVEKWGWAPDYVTQPRGSQSGGERGEGYRVWGPAEVGGRREYRTAGRRGVGSQGTNGAEGGWKQQWDWEGLIGADQGFWGAGETESPGEAGQRWGAGGVSQGRGSGEEGSRQHWDWQRLSGGEQGAPGFGDPGHQWGWYDEEIQQLWGECGEETGPHGGAGGVSQG
ncbi:hypothetical protein NDU88_003603 [Pleurodeles waltl]|uniref:Uncharacterized protein n=1 Tax=Pleurodeles waltl TaxID=8319 RepID=A0AAV7PCP9_PLEWA|nr:hypothetical protein NDU88_003603 [Pleurodeles waltl]